MEQTVLKRLSTTLQKSRNSFLSIGMVAVTLLFAQDVFAVPAVIAQHGRVFDADDQPLSGDHSVDLRIYDAATGGTLLWNETQTVAFQDGYYAVFLGDDPVNAIDWVFSAQEKVYLTFVIGSGSEFSPRQVVVSVPYAIQADTATNVSGGVADVTSLSIDGTEIINSSGTWVGAPNSLGATLGGLTCTDAQIAKWNDTASQWECAADEAGSSSIDHGTLTGLADDDHSQYHNDARGDSRYYTETELDAGQLDNRYYTETELDGGHLDSRYFTETEHLTTSSGAGDSGGPVVLNASGLIDDSMLSPVVELLQAYESTNLHDLPHTGWNIICDDPSPGPPTDTMTPVTTSEPGLYAVFFTSGLRPSGNIGLGLRLRDTAGAGTTRAKTQLNTTGQRRKSSGALYYEKTTTTSETLEVQWASNANENIPAGETLWGETLPSVTVYLLRYRR